MKTNRKYAFIAGFALLFMAVLAAFSFGYAHNNLVIPGNAYATVSNLRFSSLLFKTEIVGWLAILFLDVVVAWSLYLFFKSNNPKLSLLTAALRIFYTIIFGAAILNLLHILPFLNGSSSENAKAQILFHLNSFETTWSFALIIFGFHLLVLGILVLQSKSIHNFWGLLLVFAAMCYTVINSAKFLLPEFENQVATAEMILSLPMAFGEVGFAFWLIIRGGKSRIVYRQTKPAVNS